MADANTIVGLVVAALGGGVVGVSSAYLMWRRGKREEAQLKVREFIERHGITFIAVAAARGEGRDVKNFLRELVRPLEKAIPVETIGDAGARSWGTSQLANQELPDVEPAVRSVRLRIRPPVVSANSAPSGFSRGTMWKATRWRSCFLPCRNSWTSRRAVHRAACEPDSSQAWMLP